MLQPPTRCFRWSHAYSRSGLSVAIALLAPLALLSTGCPDGFDGSDGAGCGIAIAVGAGSGDGLTSAAPGDNDGVTDGPEADGSGVVSTTLAGIGSGDDDALTIPARPTAFTVAAPIDASVEPPGQPGASFALYSAPLLDRDGRVAFWAGLSNAAAGVDTGLYVLTTSGEVLRVLDEGSSAPGDDSALTFGTLQLPAQVGDLAWGADGRLVFSSPIASDGAAAAVSFGVYRWRQTASGADLIRVFDSSQHRALYTTVSAIDTLTVRYDMLGVSRSNRVTALASYTLNLAGIADQNAVMTSIGQGVERIVDAFPEAQFEVPDHQGATYEALRGRIATANDGAVLYAAAFASGPDESGAGVFLRAADEVLLRVIDNRVGSDWADLPLGVVVDPNGVGPRRMAIGVGERIAIETDIDRGAGPRPTVLYYGNCTWFELGGNGQVASRLLSSINDRGQVVVLAGGRPFVTGDGRSVDLTQAAPLALQDVDWSDAQAAINNNGRVLLRYPIGAGAGLAFWNGAQLLPIPERSGDGIEIIGRPETRQAGRSGPLNDDDRFVFRVAGETIFVGTPNE